MTESTDPHSSPSLALPYRPRPAMSWSNWFGGRKDHKESARDAIVGLRQQLLMLEKKEEYTQKQIEEETRKAKANATSNQRRKSGPLSPSDSEGDDENVARAGP